MYGPSSLSFKKIRILVQTFCNFGLVGWVGLVCLDAAVLALAILGLVEVEVTGTSPYTDGTLNTNFIQRTQSPICGPNPNPCLLVGRIRIWQHEMRVKYHNNKNISILSVSIMYTFKKHETHCRSYP